MAQYDLTNVLAKSLDRHLMFPLLEWLSSRQIFSEADIQKAKIDLLQKTNMVDYAMDVYMQHYNKAEPPAAMVERRGEVVAKLKSLQVQRSFLLTYDVSLNSSVGSTRCRRKQSQSSPSSAMRTWSSSSSRTRHTI